MVTTLADKIATVMATKLTPAVTNAFFADRYRIVRTVKVDDNRGGSTTTETTLEAGNRCKLSQENTRSFEGAQGGTLGSTSSYIALLPLTSDVQDGDRLDVQVAGTGPWRQFDITAIKRTGGIGLQVKSLELEERT